MEWYSAIKEEPITVAYITYITYTITYINLTDTFLRERNQTKHSAYHMVAII